MTDDGNSQARTGGIILCVLVIAFTLWNTITYWSRSGGFFGMLTDVVH